MYGRSVDVGHVCISTTKPELFTFFDWDIYKHVSPFQVHLVIVRVRHNETWPLYKADQYFYHHHYSVRLIVCSFLQVEEPRRVCV